MIGPGMKRGWIIINRGDAKRFKPKPVTLWNKAPVAVVRITRRICKLFMISMMGLRNVNLPRVPSLVVPPGINQDKNIRNKDTKTGESMQTERNIAFTPKPWRTLSKRCRVPDRRGVCKRSRRAL